MEKIYCITDKTFHPHKPQNVPPHNQDFPWSQFGNTHGPPILGQHPHVLICCGHLKSMCPFA